MTSDTPAKQAIRLGLVSQISAARLAKCPHADGNVFTEIIESEANRPAATIRSQPGPHEFHPAQEIRAVAAEFGRVRPQRRRSWKGPVVLLAILTPAIGLAGMKELPVLAFWHRQVSDRTAPLAASQGVKAGPALRIELPIPRLLVQDARGTPGEPVQLSTSVQGEADGAYAMIAGLVQGMTFSSGTAIGSDGWRVPATDLEGIWIGPPTQFVGEVDLKVELHLADHSIADRKIIHLQWAALSSVFAAPNPPTSEQPSASGDLPAANLALRSADNATECRHRRRSNASSRTDGSAPPSLSFGEPIDTPAPASPAMSAEGHDPTGEANSQKLDRTAAATSPGDVLDQGYMDRTAGATGIGDAYRSGPRLRTRMLRSTACLKRSEPCSPTLKPTSGR